MTPSSKVVGDFAQWMVSNGFSAEQVKEKAEHLDFPSSVVEFFQGYLGQPYGGFPEPLRTHVIRNKPKIEGRPGTSLPPLDFKKIKADLRAKFGKHITDVDVMSYSMYPKVFEEYQGFVEKYGDLRFVILSVCLTLLTLSKYRPNSVFLGPSRNWRRNAHLH